MEARVISEYGYDEAALGFSLSYNSTVERAKEIMPRFAHGAPGENKFLESIIVYLDIKAPRFWWQEFDTYRVGVTKQSESTMHTLTKSMLTQDNFEYKIDDVYMGVLNNILATCKYYNSGKGWLEQLKSALPEGFLQRRIVCTNYKALKNIYEQRQNHRLEQWRYFCTVLLNELEHIEFIV